MVYLSASLYLKLVINQPGVGKSGLQSRSLFIYVFKSYLTDTKETPCINPLRSHVFSDAQTWLQLSWRRRRSESSWLLKPCLKSQREWTEMTKPPNLGPACTFLKYFPSWVDYHINLPFSQYGLRAPLSHTDRLSGKLGAVWLLKIPASQMLGG